MTSRILHSDWKVLLSSLAVLIMGIAFLTVGISRWVEFLDYGFSPLRRTILMVLHVLGCLVMAAAFALFALDLDRHFTNLIMGLMASGVVLLFPIHIYIGLLRRKFLRSKSIK